mgnify:CR=1 FL=1
MVQDSSVKGTYILRKIRKVLFSVETFSIINGFHVSQFILLSSMEYFMRVMWFHKTFLSKLEIVINNSNLWKYLRITIETHIY